MTQSCVCLFCCCFFFNQHWFCSTVSCPIFVPLIIDFVKTTYLFLIVITVNIFFFYCIIIPYRVRLQQPEEQHYTIPTSVCSVFLCPECLGILMCACILMHANIHGGCTEQWRKVCTEMWLWEKSPLSRQGIQQLFGWTLYQLSCPVSATGVYQMNYPSPTVNSIYQLR